MSPNYRETSALPPPVPEIPVGDLVAGLAHYRDKLGFTVDWQDEELGLAGLSQGKARLFMGAAPYRAHLKTAGPQVIWFNLDGRAEVDALHARWQAAGAKVGPLRPETPHKLHEFLAFDPDGNILRVFYDYGWEEREGRK